jgi:hypothetical protein
VLAIWTVCATSTGWDCQFGTFSRQSRNAFVAFTDVGHGHA